MNVLDTIDTTVTFEWGETRTIGTLVQLGGRLAVVTSLRAPVAGTSVFLRVEGDSPQDGIALDGVCTEVTDSDWGEQQVSVAIQRVGTTVSAVVLRAFIEKHAIDRGGTVSIGRNRDNPDLKRYVYSLPESAGQPHDSDTTRMMAIVGTEPPERQSGGGVSSAPVERHFPLEAPPPVEMPDLDHDLNEAILVNTVAAGVAFADPVLPDQRGPGATSAPDPQAGGSLVQRLFGKKVTMPEKPATESVAPVGGSDAAQATPARGHGFMPPAESVGSVDRNPALGPGKASSSKVAPSSRDKPVSGSFQAVQALFAVDQAVRADMPVQFESGKKRRSGVMVRVAESKFRIRSSHQLQLYERIVVVIPATPGRKDTAMVQCEVIRVRPPDGDANEPSFDARVTGGNTAQTMTRVRSLIAQLEPTQGRAAG